MKILITGGHPSPAAAIVDRLLKELLAEIVFVGRKKALSRDDSLSFEYLLMSKKNVKFINLDSGKLARTFSFAGLIDLLKLPTGFFQAWPIISREKPEIVLSFGGYIALPLAAVAFLKKIPVYTHEQTLIPGLTNKIISRIATKVFVSFPQSKKFFNQNKVIVTGNPLREYIFKKDGEKFKIPRDRPIIYITGGSLGSHSINLHIEKILSDLTSRFTIIHQTGDIGQYGDFERLSKKAGNRYIVRKHILEEEIGYIYSVCDLVIARSGANTVSELIALKKPSILIPLPWAGAGEQLAQATLLKEAGVAEIFDQMGESPQLFELVNLFISNLNKYKGNFDKLKDYEFKDPIGRIIDEILPKT